MSTLKDLTNTTPLHTRQLEFKVYDVSDKQILLEGWLKDDRFIKTYAIDGEDILPGKVHRICVRMLLGGWPLEILDAEADMPHIPKDECIATQDTVKKIIGLKISHGYSDKVHKLLGGVKGCTHMAHLIITMGNAAIQGFWSHRQQKKPQDIDPKKRLAEVDFITNSCRLWREDGPHVKKIREILNKC